MKKLRPREIMEPDQDPYSLVLTFIHSFIYSHREGSSAIPQQSLSNDCVHFLLVRILHLLCLSLLLYRMGEIAHFLIWLLKEFNYLKNLEPGT